MRKHVMALTYQPKIEPVKDGRCTQTIRKGRKVSVDNEILFHGWAGKPYRSKWDWRKRVVVTEVYNIQIVEYGIIMGSSCIPWHSDYIYGLAEFDFIDPPTGEALRDVLFSLNGAPDRPEEYQIIRWNNAKM